MKSKWLEFRGRGEDEPTGIGLSQVCCHAEASRTFYAAKNTFHPLPYVAIVLAIGRMAP
jgi:hypothetical protein